MSSTLTKNIVLSQHKVGSTVETPSAPILAYEIVRDSDHTVLKVEIPGVDPSTVAVSSEGAVLSIDCPRGSLTHTVDVLTDMSAVRADIQWGLLTLRIPHPPAPATHSIKVSVHDTVKSAPASKAKTKEEFTAEE